MTGVLRHTPLATEISPGLWRASCGCGWVGKQVDFKEAIALAVAEKHAKDKGCGKRRFFSSGAADEAVLDAKLARGLEGRHHRREERAYRCPVCPGEVFHLTSKPLKERP